MGGDNGNDLLDIEMLDADNNLKVPTLDTLKLDSQDLNIETIDPQSLIC